MAVAVAMLMIGGEFDLSAGAMIGTTGLTTGILMTEYEHQRLAGDPRRRWCSRWRSARSTACW